MGLWLRHVPGGLANVHENYWVVGVSDVALDQRKCKLLRLVKKVPGESRPSNPESLADERGHIRIWLAPEMGFLPLREETYFSKNRLWAKIEYVYQKHGEVWVPKTMKLAKVGRRLGEQTTQLVLSDIRVNREIDDDVFRFRFPPGTLVNDNVAGIVYRVGEEPAGQEDLGLQEGLPAKVAEEARPPLDE